ncbi:ABC transporter substrate-binding protein [Rathayibacter sp. VKM Ac-2630]|uniref:ABC transporter substrate-binding protein n=1 Tax=Rathayibacter sp. VKM Ac-2630 TaxID=1938617 RepID=UPI0009818325|nr:ABC transporter substrate-binding protein [Rathayibacter sp. VKM Ac-2630]
MRARRSVLPLLLVPVLLLCGCASPGGVDVGVDDGSSGDPAVRTVETVFGAVEVPAVPERVVVVQSRALDLALALGVPAVGSTYWSKVNSVPAYLEDEVPTDFVLVGNDDEPDFEAIAALQPDLIIGDEGVEPNLATFQDIAPVAAYASVGAEGDFDWRTQLESVAEFTGTRDRAEEVLSEFEAMVAELDADVEIPGQTVAPLRVRADQVRWHLPGTFAGAHVLSSMRNVTLPSPVVPSENGNWSVIPAERLDTIDTDRVIAFLDSDEAYRVLEGQSLWQQTPAVRNGGVCTTDELDAWILGGPFAAEVVAADVRACLAS